MRVSRIFIYGVPGSAIFSHNTSWKTIFGKMLLKTKCLFWFSLQYLLKKFLILWRNERDMIINICWHSYKVPLFLSDFKETLIFSSDFGKILKHEILWKSVQWEPSCSTRTDGRTDMTKLIVTVAILRPRLKSRSYITPKFLHVTGIQRAYRRATYDVSRYGILVYRHTGSKSFGYSNTSLSSAILT